MILQRPIVGDTLELRQLDSTNASSSYLSWLSNPDVNRYLEVRFAPPESVQGLNQYMESMKYSPKELLLGIFLSKNQLHIGNIKLGPVNWIHGTAEIGLVIGDQSQWGKGYATIAIQMLSDYAFDTLNLHKLMAGCYSLNIGSIRSFIKAGFIQEGLRVDRWQTEGARCDEVLLSMIKSTRAK